MKYFKALMLVQFGKLRLFRKLYGGQWVKYSVGWVPMKFDQTDFEMVSSSYQTEFWN